MIDTGIFNSSNFRDGDQYFVRIDKQLKADRLYGSAFWTNLNYGGPAVIPQFSTTNHNTQQALQINYTHIFSSSTLNEAIFAQNRIEGFIGETGDFTIPSISVTGQSVGYGVGFAQGNFIQHNYHWRDVLTHVRGTHVLKFGYEGWFGDDVEPFQGPWAQPKFSFDNLLTLAQDAPLNEGGVMYDPIAGQQKLWEWNAASRTWGAFAQDTWTARRNLTVTLGFRYDDQGNPYSRTDTTVFGNFYLGDGSSFQEQVANGVARPTKNALKNSPKAFNPRAGVAWDVAGNGEWVVRSGFGVYANWLTSANVQEEFRGNPPGLILPTFFAGSSTPPIFSQGSGSTPPFGFTFPSLAGSALCPTAPCLDAQWRHRGRRRADWRDQSRLEVSHRVHLHRGTRTQDWPQPRGTRALQRIALHQPRWQRQPGGPRQLRRGHQRAARRSAQQAAGLGADAPQSELRVDCLCGQRSRGQLQRDHVQSQGTRERHVLRRLLHAIELEGRCRQLPDGDQPAPVLRAVAVGRAESILGHADIRDSGHERRPWRRWAS